MIFGSVCSGIEAATVAWEPLGMKASWYSEIEPFPCAVLKHHYLKTPNLGDMTKLQERKEFNDTAIDVLIGGTPCQSFSVAGLRKGLADPRGNLALVFLGIVDKKRPSWVVWENVPGVLSSNGGRDFGAFLGGLAELGYGVAYRVLDAQYFGVPQRRRRVFVVGYLGDWRPAAAVLFEFHSLSGDPAPGREKGKGIAPAVTSGSPFSRTGNERVEAEALVTVNALTATGVGTCGADDNQAQAGHLIAFHGSQDPDISGDITHPVGRNQGLETCIMAHGQGNAEIRSNGSSSLTCNHEAPIVVTPINTQVALRHNALGEATGFGVGEENAPAYTLQANHHYAIFKNSIVRRLTPRECERLQGFPDDYTNIPWRGKPESPDGPRYKALGNSMAVPVIRWIGERILLAAREEGERQE